MVDKLPAALQMEMETEHLPRYNMRRAASRPPPSARTRVLAKPQTESTLVQTRPSGAAPQINDVVVALVQAAAAIAKEVAATGPEPLVAAVDIKHADLQQLVSSDLLLTLMPEAEPEVDAAVKDLDVESRPLLSVDADASPLDAKPCVGRTSPTDVISAATGWSVPSRSCAEPLTPILAPRASRPWVCAFPECTKAYVKRDQLRKHARSCHAEWLRSNHKSFYTTSDEVEGSLWGCAEATGWCVLDDSQPGRYLYVAPSGRVFTSKKAAEAMRDQEETMMLRCNERIDDLAEQLDSPVLAEALQSLCRASATVHSKKRKPVFGGGSTMATLDQDWTPLIAHSFPKTVAPTPPASPLRLVAHVSTRKISFPKTVAPTPQASPLRLAHVSTRKIRTVAWEEHSKPKHVLDEDVLREGQAAATKHVSAANPDAPLPWSFWQASTADVELMLLEEHHALLSPTRAPHSGRESPLNLKLVSDPHSSDLAKFMSAELEPSASHPSPTFIGHNFMDELSYSPAKPAQVTCSALVQAAKDKSKAAAEQARAATGPLEAVKAVATGPLKVAKAEQAKAAFCTLSKALQGNHDVPCRLPDRCLLAGPDGCTLTSRHKGLCALRQLEGRRNHRPPTSPKLPSPTCMVRDVAGHGAQALALGFGFQALPKHAAPLPKRAAPPSPSPKKRAAPPPPLPSRKHLKKPPVDEIERIGLKLASVDTWAVTSY